MLNKLDERIESTPQVRSLAPSASKAFTGIYIKALKTAFKEASSFQQGVVSRLHNGSKEHNG